MTENVTAFARHQFAKLSAEQAYDAWVDPATVRLWMEHHLKQSDTAADVTRIEINPSLGGRFLFADTREGSECWGYYRALERPRRIAFTWFVSPEEEAEDNSLVTIDIAPLGKGCAVTIGHEMSAEWADYVDQTAKAWASMLEAIEGALG